ncbi:MAG: cobalt-factor II C(20)-methyltransferase [Thermoproteaceae archaeon]|jgi:precorrin-2/cobalt-factor-2 C20-methyltransferase|nr:cobalt-factor II C(20)-methyltransferase [Thermoproteaceae archaeon]
MIRVVGLGPGNPSLVTVRAVEILRNASMVYVPASSRSERSLAERIVRAYTSADVVTVEFPMGAAAESLLRDIASKLERAGDAVYAQLGDPALYSTFARLLPYIKSPVEFVPGVSSIIACAQYAGRVLVSRDQAVAIVPASRRDLLEAALKLFDVVVAIKANTNIDLLNELLKKFDGVAVKRCYMEGGAVAREISWRDYFTVVYIWRNREPAPAPFNR